MTTLTTPILPADVIKQFKAEAQTVIQGYPPGPGRIRALSELIAGLKAKYPEAFYQEVT